MVKWLYFLGVMLFLFLFISPVQRAEARGRPGVCGSTLPRWGYRYLGKHRYATAYRSMPKLLKFYRKLFGYRSKKYKVIHMFSLPNVTAYHIKSLVPSTRWAGLNLTYYRLRNEMQIFVICRKKRR